MTLGGSTHAYGEPTYWDRRYRQAEGAFDWYQKYKALSPLLDLYLRRDRPVLVVGCGNSTLGEEMVEDGYVDVVNVDISSVVIEAMQKKYHDVFQLKYVRMDVRDMSEFESESFDAIVDKGTLDSLMVSDHIWRSKFSVGFTTRDMPVDCESSCDRTEKSSEHQSWELTRTVPLNEDGSFSLSVLGPNPEIHYIYVCVKKLCENGADINAQN
ncbi:hypothetical protein QJS10_CPA05g00121 [Acorus calamus]|uniref:Methyltransferase domain-containing protein n=1 Tax=Acorus calamus TaxID=4465 RepID=A0AAV9ERU7_ACOCL|nr:hypothetical protein QJS10_CPA05g00121 [Acorus calamus]